ncbi:MAG: phospholipase D-like domain-containing protein [Gemmatimonadaceae bacterium]
MTAHPLRQLPHFMTRRLRAPSLSWRARLLMAAVAFGGASLAVFRATVPDVQTLVIQPDIALVDAEAQGFPRVLESYTGARLESGNSVDLLLNGHGTYPRLWRDLRAARRSITVQSYYAKPGAITDSLSQILQDQARAGVHVLLLLDAFGSSAMSHAWIREMRRQGVRVALLRPVHWHSMHGAADRSHVRVVVIDGRVGYTGGFGFADYWDGDGRHEQQWRETNVRAEGPVALQFQTTFAAGWLEATGELLTDRVYLGADSPRDSGTRDAALLFTTTSTGSTTAERFLALAILSARRQLHVTNSYFVPSPDFRRLLAAAVRRGVDVRILTAGNDTDVRTTRYAGRYHYEKLLRAGVRIYEYQAAMMHAKTMTVDGLWATVGSMNFDNRSLAFNDESTLLVRDRGFVAEMDSVFAADLGHAREITLDTFRRRGALERLLEIGANLLSALL